MVRGEATLTSDLDLVVVTHASSTHAPRAPYRESFMAHGWPVEAFVHSEPSLRQFFESHAARRRPSLPQMCAEGLVLRDAGGLAERVKQEARALLEAGPPPLSALELKEARYFLTDELDDFLGAPTRLEATFVLAELLPKLCDFVFDTQGVWRGGGKWNSRKLARLAPELFTDLVAALELFYAHGTRDALTKLVEGVLEPFGGRLFEGFSLGKSAS